MSSGPTLNSRLRVLVAKTFRAEKLYSSIRNSRGEKLASVTSLSEMANDIRAKEWQKSHFQLRTALNDIIALGSSSAVLAELLNLRERFLAKAEESARAVSKGTETLLETAKRHEFAHIFRISVELIRYKARAQANSVIADEIAAVLEASGRNTTGVRNGADRSMACETGAQILQDEGPVPEKQVVNGPPSNVIPLKRKAAGGGGQFRRL